MLLEDVHLYWRGYKGFSPTKGDLLVVRAARPIAPVAAAQEILAPRRLGGTFFSVIFRLKDLMKTVSVKGNDDSKHVLQSPLY